MFAKIHNLMFFTTCAALGLGCDMIDESNLPAANELAEALEVEEDREPDPSTSIVEARTFDAAQIRSAAARLHHGPETDRIIHEYVAAQARAGRLVDAMHVNAALLGSGELAWEDGAVIEEARYLLSRSAAVEPGTRGAAGEVLEIDYQSTMEAGRVDPLQDDTLVGPGMTGAKYSGGTQLQNTCQTWTVSGRSITGCYQLFRPTNDGSGSRDYYAYNRWATAIGSGSAYPANIDVRSRPHANYSSRVVGLSNYFPFDSTHLCNQGSSANVGLGSLSLTFGLTNCADKYSIPNANTKTMGVIYDDGVWVSGPLSKGVDFEMEVFAWQGGATPVMGDYNYAMFCQGSCTGTLGKDGW